MDSTVTSRISAKEKLDNSIFIREVYDLNTDEILRRLLDSIPLVCLVLNKNNQIVFCNDAYFRMDSSLPMQKILGLKPGELLDCSNSFKSGSGCGTSESCKYCGVVTSIEECHRIGSKVTKELRISMGIDGLNNTYEIKVTASPIELKDKSYTLFSLQDISNEKRRHALERIFFHDLLNKTSSLNSILESIKLPDSKSRSHNVLEIATNLSSEVFEEISAQRSLLEAENGDLRVVKTLLNSYEIVQSAVDHISFHTSAYEKSIKIPSEICRQTISTDYNLISRVLMNMIKNALEATAREGIVTVNCFLRNSEMVFSVHNTNEIDEQIKSLVFQRSFSTKATNRGLGTYSMKLLGEKYLGGRIYFESTLSEGTTFYFALPITS